MGRQRHGTRPGAARITLGIASAALLLAVPSPSAAASDTVRRIPPDRSVRASSLHAGADPSPYRIRRFACGINGGLVSSTGPTVIVGFGGDGGDANRARGGSGAVFVLALEMRPMLGHTLLEPGCAGGSTEQGAGAGGSPNGGNGGFSGPTRDGAGGGGSTRITFQLMSGVGTAVAAGGGGAGAGGPAGAGGDGDARGGGGTRGGGPGGVPGQPGGGAPGGGLTGDGAPQSLDPLQYGAGGGGGGSGLGGAGSGGGGGSSLISSARAAGGGGGGSSAIDGPFPSGFTASLFGRGHGTRDGGGVLLVTAKPAVRAPYWPGWDIVRGVATHPRSGGYVLDGFGGLHRFGQGADPRPPVVANGPYWNGIDIARGAAMLPDGSGGFVLDGWGGLHGFSVGTNPKPVASGGPYWPGIDIARGVSILPDGSGGYVVDGSGGLHRFGINGHARPPVSVGTYFPGQDVVRGVTSPFNDGGRPGGYVGLINGEVIEWGRMLGAPVEPAVGAPFLDPDLARGLASFNGALGGFVVDAYGGLHAFASPALRSRTLRSMAWEGDDYQRRFDALAAQGTDVHGEAGFVARLVPRSVLDAGCGTGRVAIELARRGMEVVGVDNDASMLATARDRGPDVSWIQADVTSLDLGREFDVVVMAGNVPLFTPPGTQAALVAGGARHVRPGGLLVVGFQLDRGYELEEYDGHCDAAGLELDRRFATWDGDPFPGDGSYAVSVHRRPPPE